ncbi:MAG: 3-oxoacyl-ACP synthase [Bacteroidetes bacterium]|nr:3-oxoacyl-ACP synthase [Bacteroidota bacterium]
MDSLIKVKLHKHCLDFVEQRISNVRSVINNATESANEDTKSSAGDKHETGRAMAQLEQEKGAKQLNEALHMKSQLHKIDPTKASNIVGRGSLVVTTEGNFYISVAAGKAVIDDLICFAISPESPIAKSLSGLSISQSAIFNQKSYTIQDIL